MALPLHIPPCIRDPRHAHHPPPFDKPLRIQIEGPLVSIKRLVPDASWHLTRGDPVPAIQPAGHALARLTYRCLYGRDPDQDKASGADKCLVVRDEYLGWIHRKNEIDYYGVTFDHLVPPADDAFPEVLQINIIDMDEDDGEFANSGILPFHVDAAAYIGKRVLAVPRCCQNRKGSTDRKRINGPVAHRDLLLQGVDEEGVIMRLLRAYGVYLPSTVQPKCDPVPQPPSKKP